MNKSGEAPRDDPDDSGTVAGSEPLQISEEPPRPLIRRPEKARFPIEKVSHRLVFCFLGNSELSSWATEMTAVSGTSICTQVTSNVPAMARFLTDCHKSLRKSNFSRSHFLSKGRPTIFSAVTWILGEIGSPPNSWILLEGPDPGTPIFRGAGCFISGLRPSLSSIFTLLPPTRDSLETF